MTVAVGFIPRIRKGECPCDPALLQSASHITHALIFRTGSLGRCAVEAAQEKRLPFGRRKVKRRKRPRSGAGAIGSSVGMRPMGLSFVQALAGRTPGQPFPMIKSKSTPLRPFGRVSNGATERAAYS
jgi:hypothetical protein